jgi:peptidoglycan LD-endopeptidase CwlK
MILKKGMQSQEIANIERAISAMGFAGIEPDGFFDEKTENVIKYIQRSHGLTPDGIIGPNTLRKLDELYQPDTHNFSSSNYVPAAAQTVIAPDERTQRKLAGVHPVLARKALQLIELAAAENYTLIVTQGLRTFAEQDALFRKRPKVTNARGGQSSHNYGVAVDFAFVVGGKISWDEKLYKNIGRWTNQLGLTWGGFWKFVDMPHVQLNGIPSYRYMLAEYNRVGGGEKGIQAVWKKYVG